MKNKDNFTKKNIAVIIIFFVFILAIFSFTSQKSPFAQYTNGEFLTLLKQKFTKYNETLPEDRVYLQFDKPFYKPGETVWFSGYVRNGKDMKASDQSDILHVELISPKGSTVKKLQIIAKKGKAQGEFDIDESFPGGMYKIKAYTNWQKNDENPPLFEKEFQVQNIVLPNLKMKLDFERKAFGSGDEVIAKLELNTNENNPLSNYSFNYTGKLDGKKFIKKSFETDETGVAYIKFNLPDNLKTSDGLLNIMIDYQGQTESISRSIPIVLNNIKFTSYPEGGDMVAGLQNTVAFKALNEFDKPADTEGIIVDENNKKVSDFKSYHQGMGTFKFFPEKDMKYYAKITKPEGITKLYELPDALPRGYMINCQAVTKERIVLDIKTTEAEELSLVAQVRGKIYYAESFKADVGSNIRLINTEDFPVGVAQLTLFDKKNIERAERLVFVNKHKQLNIKVETDKEKYLPREKVNIKISVTDERGIPMPANLSLSVSNDQLLSFADDKSGNILSQLLLEQDINEKVEEPAFYFDKNEPKADKALNYLLMTSGWRRFTWKKILEEDIPAITYNAEKAEITGTVMSYYDYKPVPNAVIELPATKEKFKADKNGKFVIRGINLSNPVNFLVSAKDFPGQYQTVYQYNSNQIFYIYSNKYSYNSRVSRKSPKDELRALEGNVPCNAEKVVANDVKIDDANQLVDLKRNKKEKIKEEKKKFAKKEVQEIELEADIEEDFIIDEISDDRIIDINGEIGFQNNGQIYHRAREFSAPVYDRSEKVEIRTDFRSTVYWNGNIEIDRKGKAEIEFYNSDEISSFRAIVEGIAADGLIGRCEKTYFTQLPFAMKVKVPTEVVFDDIVSIPLTLTNNTDFPVSGVLDIENPQNFSSLKNTDKNQTLKARESKVIYLKYKVLNKQGVDKFKIAFESAGLADAFVKEIKTVSKGFPASVSISGQELEEEYVVNISNVIDGSLTAQFNAFPSVVSDLTEGIESILREPSGCFEQTSMSSYPNVMVLNYIDASDNISAKLEARAKNLLRKGYSRLTTFETPSKGYDWFGSSPANEALTAYGLMQFNEMKKHSDKVDQKMIDRTAEWLMSRKDAEGGFKRNNSSADYFGRADVNVTNAYIVYALSEAGYADNKKELNKAYDQAIKSKDPYQLALVANAAYNLNDKTKGDKALKELLKKQNKDGSWNGSIHSITRSTGNSLLIETTSLSVLALMKSSAPDKGAINKGIKYLVSNRSGFGAFGSTQGTILALKALTEYSIFSRRAEESGTIQIFIDGKKVVEKHFEAGCAGPIEIENFQEYIKPGKHKIKVKYKDIKKPLPYSIGIDWTTTLPNSQKECSVALKCKLKDNKVNVGETVRMEITLTNKTEEGLPSTIAIIGLPAGLSPQPWQLKEIQEKKIADYYEVVGNNIILYYRQMKPSEVKHINLDLKAEIPGEYEAPASCAYLYYTNEFKDWKSVDKITVLK